MAKPGVCHEVCMKPKLPFQVQPGEADEEMNDRFQLEHMGDSTIEVVTAAAIVIPDDLMDVTDLPTVTRPPLDPTMLGWIQIGIDRLLSIENNRALPDAAQWAAYKIRQLTPLMLLHAPATLKNSTKRAAPELAKAVSGHASMYLQGKFVELIEVVASHRDAYRDQGVSERSVGLLVLAAIRLGKFRAAGSTVASHTKSRSVPRIMPPHQAKEVLEAAYARAPVHDDAYTDGKCFEDADVECIDGIAQDQGELLTAKSVRKGYLKIQPNKSGGPAGAKKEHWLFLLGKDMERYGQVASSYNYVFRAGIRGLPSAREFPCKVRDWLTSKGAFALTKPNKPGEGRNVAPPSTESKMVSEAVISPAHRTVKKFLEPHQVALKTTDGNVSLTTMVQMALDFSSEQFENWLKGHKGVLSPVTVVIMFDLVKMYPSMRRRHIMKHLLRLVREHSDSEGGVHWQRVMLVHAFMYGSPLMDFYINPKNGQRLDLEAADGYCIGELLAAMLSMLGEAFLFREAVATRKGAALRAHPVASADNCDVIGAAKDSVAIVRRIIEIANLEGLSDLQEQVCLRAVRHGFKHGAYDTNTEAGRAAITDKLRDGMWQLVQSNYGTADIHPKVFQFWSSMQFEVRGVKHLGSPVGQPMFCKQFAERKAQVYVDELKALRQLPEVDGQAAVCHYMWSHQQRFQHIVKTVGPWAARRAAKQVGEAGYEFFASHIDHDPAKPPPKLSAIQRAWLDCPEQEAGGGKVNYVERVDAGAHAVGVVGALNLAQATACAHLINIVRGELARRTSDQYYHALRRRNESRDLGSVGYNWAHTRSTRRAMMGSEDSALPKNPATVANGKAPGRELHGRLMAPAHANKVKALCKAARNKHHSERDRRTIAGWEQRRQLSAKGGCSQIFSIVPTCWQLRLSEFEFRHGVTVLLGCESESLHRDMIGLHCVCDGKPVIATGYHFQQCSACGRSAAHNAARDNVAEVVQSGSDSRTSVTIEPKGAAVGRAPNDKKGPDLMALRTAHGQSTVIDFVTCNPTAHGNVSKLLVDAQQTIGTRADVRTRKAASTSADDSNSPDCGSAASLTTYKKTATKLIHDKETGSDAQRARAIGLTLKAGPVSTIGAARGQVWHEVDKVLHKGPTRDDMHRMGWSTPTYRSWLMLTTIIVAWKASARTALQCARAACSQRNKPLPGVASSAWVTPCGFLESTATEIDIEAIGEIQEPEELDTTTEYGERRHVHEQSAEAMPATEAAAHAAMRDHTFQVTNNAHAQQREN